MKKQISLLMLMLGLLAGLLLTGIEPAAASSTPELDSAANYLITLDTPQPSALGEPFVLQGTILSNNGQPLADSPIVFLLDGITLGQTRSDSRGRFERKFNTGLKAGYYSITAIHKRAGYKIDYSISKTLQIMPAEVRVQTVPAVSGVAFEIDGNKFYSDETGLATIQLRKAGTYQLHVLPAEYNNPAQRIEFGRWLEEIYEPSLAIEVPTDRVYQVGLDLFHRIGQSFTELDGDAVDEERITEFMIRSAQGDVFVFPDGQPRWIPASRVARRLTGLEETKLLYSLISVKVDGSNVVNQSQQRFFTEPDATWEFSLLLYSLRVTVKDGLLGSPIGTSINLEFPDGRIENFPLDENGSVEIHTLARGNYYIEPVGVRGMVNRTPVALSRNQDVLNRILTYADLSLVGALGLIAALGLLLYGRPWILQAALRNKRPIAFDLQQTNEKA